MDKIDNRALSKIQDLEYSWHTDDKYNLGMEDHAPTDRKWLIKSHF